LDSFYEDLEIEVMITMMRMITMKMMMAIVVPFHSRQNREPPQQHVHFLPLAHNLEALQDREDLLEALLEQRRGHQEALLEQKALHAVPLEQRQALPEAPLVLKDHRVALLEALLAVQNEPLNHPQ
tara:strand:+ start:233 stop:610 length:378 start_codon:yes stop_codon:yes gene_type:complete